MPSFGHHRLVDAEHYQDLADQDLDRAMRTNDPSRVAQETARAQINALLAIASAVDRLAKAIEAHGTRASD